MAESKKVSKVFIKEAPALYTSRYGNRDRFMIVTPEGQVLKEFSRYEDAKRYAFKVSDTVWLPKQWSTERDFQITTTPKPRRITPKMPRLR